MNALFQYMGRMIAVIRSLKFSGGRLLATSVNLTLLGALTRFLTCSAHGRAEAQGLKPFHAVGLPATSAKEWWEHVNVSPILVIVFVLAFVAAYSHAQLVLAACIDVLSKTIADAARANNALAESFDRLLDAVRWLLRFEKRIHWRGGIPRPRGPDTRRNSKKEQRNRHGR